VRSIAIKIVEILVLRHRQGRRRVRLSARNRRRWKTFSLGCRSRLVEAERSHAA
jgi:hypothetical protein